MSVHGERLMTKTRGLFSSRFQGGSSLRQTKSYNLTDLDKFNSSEEIDDASPGSDSTGLVSTQQLPIDWSLFQNHTFFNSAEAKTNVAFKKVLSDFPLDGTEIEINTFLNTLTGFEKYIYSLIPKYKGALYFNGQIYIEVQDKIGYLFRQFAKGNEYEQVLDPKTSSLSVEFWLKIDDGLTDSVQILFQKRQSNVNHISCAIVRTTNVNTLVFAVGDGTKQISATYILPNDVYKHICLVLNQETELDKLEIYVDEILVSESIKSKELSSIVISDSTLLIGAGDPFNTELATVTPVNLLSGTTIDEFRWWHEARSMADQINYGYKNVFSNDTLKLKFGFNEPFTGLSATYQPIVLDGSGYGLHSSIQGTLSLANRISTNLPLIKELDDYCIILFPEYTTTQTLAASLLQQARFFDIQNPNIITKLIPPQYLKKYSDKTDLSDEEQSIQIVTEGSYQNQIVQPNDLMQPLLYTWATLFDEIKLFIDYFSKLEDIDYSSQDRVPDKMLSFLAKKYGIILPNLFGDYPVNDFFLKEGADSDLALGTVSLANVQNQIWRRILTNLQEILRSKGTLHAVKTFIRSLGVDPDINIRIKEYGGSNTRKIDESKIEAKKLMNYVNLNSYVGYVSTPELYNSTTSYNITSNSFTCEGFFKLDNFDKTSQTQASIFRLVNQNNGLDQVLLNLVAVNDIFNPQVVLSIKSSDTETLSTIFLDGVNLFDGEWWNIQIGRCAYDDLGLIDFDEKIVVPNNKDVFFVRCSKQYFGTITESYESYDFIDLDVNSKFNIIENTETYVNLDIGERIYDNNTDFLNSDVIDVVASHSGFRGWVGPIKIWSKYINSTEYKAHAISFTCVGVDNPSDEFNFTESNKKIQVAVDFNQPTITTDLSGELDLVDYSQSDLGNSLLISTPGTIILDKTPIWYAYINSRIDEPITSNKVRVRSFQSQDLVDKYQANLAPLNHLAISETQTDDNRLSIEFSMAEVLDRDISNIFATLNEIEKAVGDPNLKYSPDYPNLQHLRRIYFTRLTDKINHKAFYEFFKWFDSSIEDFIKLLIPYNTKYLGNNYVIESHSLERGKFEYPFVRQYILNSTNNGTARTF